MKSEMKMTRQCPGFMLIVLIAMGIFPAGGAVAEQADRTKPVEVEADAANVDQSKRLKTLEGNAILTQGTMRLTAERIVIKEDDAGYTTAQIFGGPKGQVVFRQKREGSADFMEGSADRAEFDDKADTVKLLSNARLKSGGDELKGEYIFYNSATEVMQAGKAASEAKSSVGSGENSGRVKITIQPKISDQKPKAPEPAKSN
jgi:lipopolysaccharide export system protein LptA